MVGQCRGCTVSNCWEEWSSVHHFYQVVSDWRAGLFHLKVIQNNWVSASVLIGFSLCLSVTPPGLQQSCGLVGTGSPDLWNGCRLSSVFCRSANPDLRKDSVWQSEWMSSIFTFHNLSIFVSRVNLEFWNFDLFIFCSILVDFIIYQLLFDCL